MEYVQITNDQRRQMLSAIGAASVEELLVGVPADIQLCRALELPPALSEQELRTELLARAGACAGGLITFAGAGAYDHYIPAVVDAMASRGEFLTAYTPYQAEASQGTLQAIFEFQTLICRLTALDVANASMYEAASALAEAVLMLAEGGKRRIILCEPLHPHYRKTVETYLVDLPLELVVLPHAAGAADIAAVKKAVNADTAAVVVQSPNFFGVIDRGVAELATIAHEADTGLVHVFDPISLALLKKPGELGADVAVGEGQPLGNPLNFGGPYLGLMAARDTLMRRMPGRLVGRTSDADGRPAYCLTLQTREQHIRRARATSNICTNEGLIALRAAIYLAAMGTAGLTAAATVSMQRAHDLAGRIGKLKGYELPFAKSPFFREFVVRCRKAKPDAIVQAGLEEGLLAGVPLGQFDEKLADCLLVACTEKRTESDVEKLVSLLASVG
jgi:glycine dehydrogenase subunit 1